MNVVFFDLVCLSPNLTYLKDSPDLYATYISLAKFNVLEALIKSLMLTKKKRGPEIEP